MLDPALQPDGLPETTLIILDRLRSAPGDVSGEVLCRELGVTRSAVWKHINLLRKWGYRIASAPHRGYRLESEPDTPAPWSVLPKLKTRRAGRSLVFFRQLHSTNQTAVRWAEVDAPDGAVVTADSQTAGRGRRGRFWVSPPGVNLHFSVVFRPDCLPRQAPHASLITAIALARTLRGYLPADTVGIKWPNDVMVSGRKIAGILCEMAAEPDGVRWLVIGVGVNVNSVAGDFPEPISAMCISLRDATGKSWPRNEVLAAFLNELEPCWDDWLANGLGEFVGEYQALCVLRDRIVTVRTEQRTIRGRALGINPDGALEILQEDGSRVAVYSGDAHIGSARTARGDFDDNARPCSGFPRASS